MASATRRRLRWLLVAAAVLAAAGYAWIRSQPVAPGAVENLRIALPGTPHAALLHIAAAKGYFAEEGLDVTIVPVSHGKAAVEESR